MEDESTFRIKFAFYHSNWEFDRDSVPELKANGKFLININPPKHMSQESMLDLRVVVPFTNLKGYHFNWSVTDLLGVYNSANEQITPDLVIPVLKKQLKEQEGS